MNRLPDLPQMRRAVAGLGMTDAQIQQALVELNHKIGLRSIWAFRKGEGNPSWKTISAIDRLLNSKPATADAEKQGDEKLKRSAA